MNEEHKLIIKSMLHGQKFVDTIDQMKGNSHFKTNLKNKGYGYCRGVEKFLNAAYGGGDTDINVLKLLEYIETETDKLFERIIEEQVEFVD